MALDTLLPEPRRANYLRRLQTDLTAVPENVRADAIAYAENLLGRGLPVLFDPSHLAFVAGIDPRVLALIRGNPRTFYSRFVIRKRSGGSRELAAPTPQLRAVQDWIHTYLTPHLPLHNACHGFVRNRSIVTNAAEHVGQPLLLKLDIKDFFGSVGRRPIYRAFRRLGYSRDISDLLTTIVSLEGGLPQGAPTSPTLANYAAYGLDVRISAYALRHGIRYTRYADDITLSGSAVGDRRVRRTVEKIMRDEGFVPNESKRRYVQRYERQRVTGIVVNDKLNWPKEHRRWLRQEVYYLHKFGMTSHLERRGIYRSSYKEYIYGHVFALKMVNADEALAHLKVLDSIDWPY